MNSRRPWLFPLLAALLVLAGCSAEPPEAPPSPEAPGELIASSAERVTPTVTPEELTSIAAGNTDFAAALYPLVARPGENLFFSPFSITQAFAMVYAGARGNTAAQMGRALHFPLAQEQLHPVMNALDLTLHSRAESIPRPNAPPPELRIVNATWGQQGYAFEPAFLDVLAQQYGAGVRAVDFKSEPDSVRARINAWIAGQTNDRIRDLLPSGSVSQDTKMVLTNALYFKGSWAAPFQPSLTRTADFHLLGGGTQQVQMMQRDGPVPYVKGDGFEALALPYTGGAFRMLLVIPDEGRFSEVEGRLSAEFLEGIRQTMVSRDAMVGLPRFQAETSFSLARPLQLLGMVDAFGPSAADLSGISRETHLYLSSAHHKAFVAVDEKGTEAAAATGIVAGDTSIPAPLIVNRPFLFLIEDVETRTVLFLGRIVKP